MSEEQPKETTVETNNNTESHEATNNNNSLSGIDFDKIVDGIEMKNKAELDRVKEEAVSESNNSNKEFIKDVTQKMSVEYDKIFQKQSESFKEQLKTVESRFNNQLEELKSQQTTEKGGTNMNNNEPVTEQKDFFEQFEDMSDAEIINFIAENGKNIKFSYGVNPYSVIKK